MTRCLPPLYALRTFETVVRHTSFIRAGEELAITQSAVNRYIRTLEEHFGCRLFGRHGRQLQLTEPACLLLPELRDGFGVLERACTASHVSDTTLCLEAPPILTLRRPLPRLNRFRHLNPSIKIQPISAWMDVGSVSFQCEPFDYAVLLDSGQFNPERETVALFAEWLVSICDPNEAVEP